MLAKELGIGRPARGKFDRASGGLRLRFGYTKPLTSDHSQSNKVLRLPLGLQPLSIVFGREIIQSGHEGADNAALLSVYGKEKVQKVLADQVSAYRAEGNIEAAGLVEIFCMGNPSDLPVASIAVSFNAVDERVAKVHGVIIAGSVHGMLSYEIVRLSEPGQVMMFHEEGELVLLVGHTGKNLEAPITIAFTPS